MERKRNIAIIVAFAFLSGAAMGSFATILLTSRIDEFGSAGDSETLELDAIEGLQGRVSIGDGDIPMRDFCKFLADFTGVPVFPEQIILEDTLVIATPIDNATFDVIRALLEANGYIVRIKWASEKREQKVIRIGKVNPP